jgi:hypothetical protein
VDTGALRGAIKPGGPAFRGQIRLAVFVDKARLPKRAKSGEGGSIPRTSSSGTWPPGRRGGAGSEGAFVPPRSYMRAGFDEAKEAAIVAIESRRGGAWRSLPPPEAGGALTDAED